MREINLGRPSWAKGLTKDSDERVRKISESNKGKHLPNEQKQKIGNSVRGQKRSAETVEIMRKNQLGKNNSFYGKKHDPETIKNKMTFNGETNYFYGKKHSKETLEKKSKNIFIITDLNNNVEETKVFSLWCEEHKIKVANFSYYINKNQFYKGYKVEKILIKFK